MSPSRVNSSLLNDADLFLPTDFLSFAKFNFYSPLRLPPSQLFYRFLSAPVTLPLTHTHIKTASKTLLFCKLSSLFLTSHKQGVPFTLYARHPSSLPSRLSSPLPSPSHVIYLIPSLSPRPMYRFLAKSFPFLNPHRKL